MSDYLYVYKGENLENIQIYTVDSKSKVYDPSWCTFGVGETFMDIKTTDVPATPTTTLSEGDFVTKDTSSVTVKIAKLAALAVGTYVAFLHLMDSSGRRKTFKYHLVVQKV